MFLLDGQRYAVDLKRVERVVPMVELARFPRAPQIVLGVFNLHGDLIPVVSPRRRFSLPDRPPTVDDHLLVLRTARRRLAFMVDRVEHVLSIEMEAITRPEEMLPGLAYVRGVVRLEKAGVIFLHDLDTFLSLDEDAQLATIEEERVTP